SNASPGGAPPITCGMAAEERSDRSARRSSFGLPLCPHRRRYSRVVIAAEFPARLISRHYPALPQQKVSECAVSAAEALERRHAARSGTNRLRNRNCRTGDWRGQFQWLRAATWRMGSVSRGGNDTPTTALLLSLRLSPGRRTSRKRKRARRNRRLRESSPPIRCR